MKTKITSKPLIINQHNIDTDQIIPSDYLKADRMNDLKSGLFGEIRQSFQEEDREQIKNKNCNILISRQNFGCGSSREHAVWALKDNHFHIIIAESFADIFKLNARRNNLLLIEFDSNQLTEMMKQSLLNIDIDQQTISTPPTNYSFNIDPFFKYLYIQQIKEFDYLLSHERHIKRYEGDHHV